MARSAPLLLQFDPTIPKRVRSALVGGLSCAVRIGDTLWTECDRARLRGDAYDELVSD